MAGKTLEDLEGVVWGDPEYLSSLVATCHRLRKKPVEEFTTEDLRIMIGQGIGLSFLLPRALDLLEGDPLTAGEYFPGDLLLSVILQKPFLSSRPELLERATGIVQTVLATLGDEESELRRELQQFMGRTFG